jgi:hypothetical protein
MPKDNQDARKAEKEIMDILSEHITPDWEKVGALMRIAHW